MRAAWGLVLAACGADGDAPVDVSSLTYTPCDAPDRVGGFSITLADTYTSVQGQVRDGVVPAETFEVRAEAGECAIVGAPTPSCTPACVAGEVCRTDGTCAAYPQAISVGEVAVRGLAAALTMTPTAPTQFYSNRGTLPHPGFAPGTGLALTAAGASPVDAFELLGWGVSPLGVAASSLEVTAGTALEVTWTPPPWAGPAKVALELNVNGHGLVGTRLLCTVDDDGAFTLPVALTDALLADGLSGFPTLELERASVDAVDTAVGCVDLRVRSATTIDVTVPGLTSCRETTDCPPGQTCGEDLACRPAAALRSPP